MPEDIVRRLGYLTLGSRLKRLGERMQADVARFIEQTALPIQPGQYPLLAAIDRYGPLSVGELVEAVGVSQPGVTRSLARLAELGLVEARQADGDQRRKTVALTAHGEEMMRISKQAVWPHVETAVASVCAGIEGPMLAQLDAIEAAIAEAPLDERAAAGRAAGLAIRPYSDALAPYFHDINAEWIEAMFAMEQADRDVLDHPRARIVDPGGDILFIEADGLGIIGTCALRKTGERQFELTKMGVRASARGLKAGEFLLRATLRRADELGADYLYLLTNSDCAAAIHLYEKLGFVHDAEVMRDFGARYARCNVAMRYRPECAR